MDPADVEALNLSAARNGEAKVAAMRRIFNGMGINASQAVVDEATPFNSQNGDRVMYASARQDSGADEGKNPHVKRPKTGSRWSSFKNYIISRMDLAAFLLIFVFGMGKRAFTALHTLCHQDWFNPKELMSYDTYKRRAQCLDLPAMFLRPAMVGPDITVTPHLNLSGCISRILEFPGNMAQCVFEPRVSTFAREFWHGRVWRESPLFTYTAVRNTAGRTFVLGANVLFRMVTGGDIRRGRVVSIARNDTLRERCAGPHVGIREYVNIPGGAEHDYWIDWDNEVWVTADDLAGGLRVRMHRPGEDEKQEEDNREAGDQYECMEPEPEICCKGATFAHEGVQETVTNDRVPPLLSDIDYHTDWSAVAEAQARGIKVLRVYVVFFFDDFAVYGKVYHKTGGGYITLGNLPRHLQNLMRNMQPVVLVPPGVSKEEALKPFKDGVRRLQQGYYDTINGERVFIVGGVGISKTDMPEGNDQAGIKGPTATYGCRMCHVSKECRCQQKVHKLKHGRTRQHQRHLMAEAQKANSKTAYTEACLVSGLRETGGVLDDMHIDQHRQIPFEVFHAEVVGNSARRVALFIGTLTDAALQELNDRLQAFALPLGWRNLPRLSLTTNKKAGGLKLKLACKQHIKSILQILPLVIQGWFDRSKISSAWATRLMEGHGGCIDTAVKLIARTIVTQSRFNAHVFAEAVPATKEYGLALVDLMRENKAAMESAWGGIVPIDNPNVHCGEHYLDALIDYGTLLNTSAARFETFHGFLRTAVTRSNHRFPEVDMMGFLLISSALAALAAGKPGKTNLSPEALQELTGDTALKQLFECAFKCNTYAGENHGDEPPRYKIHFGQYLGTGPIDSALLTRAYGVLLGMEWSPIDAEPVTLVSYTKHLQLSDREAHAAEVAPGAFYDVCMPGDTRYTCIEVVSVMVHSRTIRTPPAMTVQQPWIMCRLYDVCGTTSDAMPGLGCVELMPSTHNNVLLLPSFFVKPVHVFKMVVGSRTHILRNPFFIK